jgi:hypothetical protein
VADLSGAADAQNMKPLVQFLAQRSILPELGTC